ncbi:SDR family NAD(P)-dependent oxidoreductase [Nitrospirillum pindoramense]|uniref:NAD(P)-dependent dehydrogenase (Short-subunit alcohol dehydrogenase family) n=1 Tax=Nitrospirillum amazonense TaxID=28077 RepID=A0A560HBV9_9PROT|nr:SDR family oxidoreductase [Nitrospirillum amazonense]TWB43853.1 NAD(P)-dependent dehydrogenase (short-subunit alcohol dehydrogenase family) [Nitrospirillum amazonense]
MTHAIYPSLRGKRVVVTGGGSGIGAAITEAFVRQGAQVSFLDIAEADSRALEQTLAESADHAPKFYKCDLTNLDQLKATLAEVQNAGAVDVLVNNAANDDRHTIEQITPEYWDNRMAVNLRHMFFASQAVVPGMKAQRSGAIINFGSISWHVALPELLMYQTAKAGIEGLTRSLARDLGEHNIRVTCVVPGGVRTERQMRLWHNPEEEARILSQQCLKERVDPPHVAAMVLFLASDDGRMCTSHEYFVDAGWR